MLLFSRKKLNFHFWFSPIFQLCQTTQTKKEHILRTLNLKTNSLKTHPKKTLIVSFGKQNEAEFNVFKTCGYVAINFK